MSRKPAKDKDIKQYLKSLDNGEISEDEEVDEDEIFYYRCQEDLLQELKEEGEEGEEETATDDISNHIEDPPLVDDQTNEVSSPSSEAILPPASCLVLLLVGRKVESSFEK
ncbi:hypothetical protein O0L34_g9087 [Tuta absoluta]|nr:hypothetical protein O0L34_g9087 [Tuta absoluta]